MRPFFQNLFALFVTVSIVSCSSSDDGVEDVSLVGTWKVSSLKVESSFDFNNDGTFKMYDGSNYSYPQEDIIIEYTKQ